MFLRQSHRHFLLLPFILALAGFLFSLWHVFSPTNLFCITSGCTLFTSFTIKGFSLWWFGATLFGLLAFCALVGSSALGQALSGFALCIDCVLLLIMLLTAPCASCLLAACLLALCYASFRSQTDRSLSAKGEKYSLPLLLWTILFIANMGLVANTSLAPQPILAATHPEERIGNVYFSPSCPACRQLVQQMDQESIKKITWFAVAEQEEDIAAIAFMQQQIQMGRSLPQAFNAAYDAPPMDTLTLFSPSMLFLQLHLYINKAHVLRSGGVLPLVEVQGLPSFMTGKSQSAMPNIPHDAKNAAQTNTADVVLPLDLDIVNRCTDEKPCPEDASFQKHTGANKP